MRPTAASRRATTSSSASGPPRSDAGWAAMRRCRRVFGCGHPLLSFPRGSCETARMIHYRLGNDLDLDAVIELYRASTLGERRPVDNRERMQAMIANADIVITAWDVATMVGIARSVSDFAYFTYLADLAVRVSHQRQGIGREL